jgi:hypothetical protein
MTESEIGQGAAGEPEMELIGAKMPDLAIYLNVHGVHRVTFKKKRVKDSDGKKRKIRIIKINPPCYTLDEGMNQPLIRKNPGIRVTEDQVLETGMWLRANRDSFVGDKPLSFGQIDKGLRAIQKKLGIKPVPSLSPKPIV